LEVRAIPEPPISVPTTTQSEADPHETESGSIEVARDAGIVAVCHVCPPSELDMTALPPTATHVDGAAHDTPFGED
jgi:hypothetical protein